MADTQNPIDQLTACEMETDDPNLIPMAHATCRRCGSPIGWHREDEDSGYFHPAYQPDQSDGDMLCESCATDRLAEMAGE